MAGAGKVATVMGEYKRGTLRSSSGRKVTKRTQAVDDRHVGSGALPPQSHVQAPARDARPVHQGVAPLLDA